MLNRIFNPLKHFSLTDFCSEKKAIDAELLETNIQGKIICGTINPEFLNNSLLPIVSIEKINDNEYCVVDIREKAESLLFRNWDIFKFKNSPINIPVSQIINFICELINNGYEKNKKIALLCSTGNRSLALAKSIRRMGYNNIWSISGGVAFAQLQFDNKVD